MKPVGLDRALAVMAAGFAVLALAAVAAIWQAAQTQRSAAWVNHSLEVENRLATVLSLLQDTETGQRGYLLTHRQEFLGPYRAASAQLPEALAGLRRAISDNPSQRALIERLAAVARSRQAVLDQTLLAARAGSPQEQTLSLERGRRLMDQARSVIGRMTTAEQVLLEGRERAAAMQGAIAEWGLAVGAAAVALLGLLAFFEGRRRVLALAEAHDQLEQANERLLRDIAARERVEAQLRQAQKMEAIGKLTGGIAHDFNNLLSVVMGSLDLARARLNGNEDPRLVENLEAAIEGAASARQLTSRLLAFARQQPLSPKPLDLNRLVAGTAALLRRTLLDGIQVETRLEDGLWRVSADAVQLESAILNLCINARDAMPEGGLLTIETANVHLGEDVEPDAAPGPFVMIAVSDTGEGMPPEVVERAFEPFYTTKGVGKGTGLGLSQVYGFVGQSGGRVQIASAEGRGATVRIYLPRLGASLPDAAAPDPPSETENG